MHCRSTTTVKNSKKGDIDINPPLGRKKRAFSKRVKKGEKRAGTFGKVLLTSGSPHDTEQWGCPQYSKYFYEDAYVK